MQVDVMMGSRTAFVLASHIARGITVTGIQITPKICKLFRFDR